MRTLIIRTLVFADQCVSTVPVNGKMFAWPELINYIDCVDDDDDTDDEENYDDDEDHDEHDYNDEDDDGDDMMTMTTTTMTTIMPDDDDDDDQLIALRRSLYTMYLFVLKHLWVPIYMLPYIVHLGL